MIKKILFTIIALCILCLTLFVQNIVSNKDMTIYVELIKDDIRIEEVITIEKDSTFLEELDKIFEIEIVGTALYKIDFIEGNMQDDYIMIMVNDSYSMYGITNLKLNDNDKVSFIYTEL